MSRNSILEYLKQGFPIPGNFDLACTVLEKDFESILDIGTGSGSAALFFTIAGKSVTSIGLELMSYQLPIQIFNKLDVKLEETSFESFSTTEKFDAIWASHVLEHNQNPGLFFEKALSLLNDDGYLFLMVPPYKEEVVGGHITNGWNMGQLMYNLLVSGFDIKSGSFISHGYNIFAAVKPLKATMPTLRFDTGDIDSLAALWPIPMTEGMIVKNKSVNWHWPPWMQGRLSAPTYDEFLQVNQELQETQRQLSAVELENKTLLNKSHEDKAYYKEIEALKNKLQHSNQLLALKTNSNQQLRRMIQAKVE